MANNIKVKRSATPSKVPTTTDLALGEIAVNTYDGKMYIKKDNGTASVVEIGGTAGSGDVVGPSSATDNAVARFDTTTGKLIQNSVVTIDDNGNEAGVNSITFDITPTTPPSTTGAMYWDEGNKSPSVNLDADVTLQLGQEMLALVYNGTGSTIPNGSVVAVSGAQGQRPSVVLADADSEALSAPTLGIATEDIANGAEGFVTTFGFVRGINTSAFTAGAPIYLSQTAGAFTATRPAAPAHTVALGWVIKVNASSGEVFVNINNGWELDELHNVLITSPISGNTLIYDASVGVWKNANITAGTGISVTNGAGSITIANTGVTSVTATSPVASTGGTTPVISMPAATTSVSGYLTSTDWNTFNGKVSSQWTTTGSDIYYNTGNVGIGTSSPAQKLHIVGNQQLIRFNTIATNSTAMNASTTNSVIGISAPFGTSPETTPNAGAKWGITLTGNGDGATTIGGTKSASVFAVSEDTGGGYNRAVGLSFFTSSFDANQAERMRIDASGLVGIGTSSPTARLDVNAGANTDIRVSTSASGYLQLGQFTNGGFIGTSSSDANAGALRLGTAATERMRITSTGFVGIGTSSPTTQLQVNIPNTAADQRTGLLIRNSTTADQSSAMTADIDFSLWDNNTQMTTPQARIGIVGDSTADQNYEAGGQLCFYTNIRNYAAPVLTERMRIHASGGISIGSTTDPGASNLSVAGKGTFTPNAQGVSTGLTVINGDLTAYRSGGTTGVVYLSSDGTKYLYNDGSGYTLASQGLSVGGNLTVGTTGNSNIYMVDTDEGNRVIHCNSNRIGFLNQAGSWGAYCDDGGNWATDFAFYGAGTGLTGTAASLTAGAATLATKSSTLASNGGNGTAMTFNWSGLGGQPPWLWGGTDGVNMYVYNPSNFNVNSATTLTSNQANWASTGVIGNVVGMLAWKNYSNNHVIFDASNGTSPSGTAVNATNSQVAWSSSYPTLMGWNGGSTYGVRVDSARVADSATTADTIDSIPFKNCNSTSVFAVDTTGTNGIGYSNGYTLFGQSDGGVYCATYSDAWQHQINGDFRTGQIAIRGKNSGTWQAWRTVLDSGNYTSYIPAASVPAGAKMLFYQASAPAGWTQDTSLNDYGLRIVSGTGGTTAGTTAFSTVFSNQTPTIGATTLSTAQMPSHTHATDMTFYNTGGGGGGFVDGGLQSSSGTGAAGGSGSHTHSAGAITLNLRYANIIICTKN